jgi:hypothetical protein
VRSELWIHCQLCASHGSQVGRDADKGAHELSFKGGIERTVMDATCCKLRQGPYLSQKRSLVCRCGGGLPRCKGKGGTQGQRLMASPVAATWWLVNSGQPMWSHECDSYSLTKQEKAGRVWECPRVLVGRMKGGVLPLFSANCFCESQSFHTAVKKSGPHRIQ